MVLCHNVIAVRISSALTFLTKTWCYARHRPSAPAARANLIRAGRRASQTCHHIARVTLSLTVAHVAWSIIASFYLPTLVLAFAQWPPHHHCPHPYRFRRLRHRAFDAQVSVNWPFSSIRRNQSQITCHHMSITRLLLAKRDDARGMFAVLFKLSSSVPTMLTPCSTRWSRRRDLFGQTTPRASDTPTSHHR